MTYNLYTFMYIEHHDKIVFIPGMPSCFNIRKMIHHTKRLKVKKLYDDFSIHIKSF